MKLWVLAVTILAPAILLGQSLGDAAAKEKDRRSKKPASPAPVYTNDTLVETKGQIANDPNAPAPSRPPGPGATALTGAGSATQEGTWRGRYQSLKAQLDSAQLAYANASQAPNVRGLRQNTRTQTNSAAALKAAVDACQKALDDLQEEARRAGVPPGWVR